ncbi:MAG: endo-1,4-beta-xylanase [Candidatus Helarchaeota archaeon]
MVYFYKKLNTIGKIGLIFFIFLNISFVFLLLSPYIPNLIGEYQDNLLLSHCNDRIQKYRTGNIKIKLQYLNGTPIPNYNLSYDLVKHEFYFGCNIFSFDSFYGADKTGYNESYRTYFKKLFNFAVLPFYWREYEPVQNRFPTENWLNKTIDWCLKNNITMKGHPLVWSRYYGVPTWLPLENNSLTLNLLHNRITKIVSKYKDKIQMWDIVNEPVHTHTFGHLSVQENILYPILWAKQANLNSFLTINDYGILGHDFGNGPFYQLISQLNKENANFDYIGLQAHEPRTDWIPATEIWNSLESYSQLGKPIYITEFTPISAPVPITNSWKKGLWSELNQAEYARRFYLTSFSHPSVKGIIWWDLTDLTSWLEGGGLLRSNMTPKPVYNTLDNLINKQWHTFGWKLTNSSGWINFQGFFGTYNISINNGTYNYQITSKSNSLNTFVITI